MLNIPSEIKILMLFMAFGLYAWARWGLPEWADLARLIDWSRAQLQRIVSATSQQPAATDHQPPTTGDLIADGKITHLSWSGLLNDEPDRFPHLLIIGSTGTGKTTFTRALLATRPGQVAILTPKPDPDDWPGIPIVTIGDAGDFAELTAAFALLMVEVRHRLVARKRGQPAGEMLTIVCDDWPVLASECGKSASDLFKLVGRLGRSLRVRLIVLSQSDRVKSLGLEGEGDAVANFARVELARGHQARLVLSEHVLPMDTWLVPQLALKIQPIERWWVMPSGTSSHRAILGGLAVPAEPVPESPMPVPAGSPAAEPVPDPEVEKIRQLSNQGWSRNQIAGEIGGRKADALERIRQVLG